MKQLKQQIKLIMEYQQYKIATQNIRLRQEKLAKMHVWTFVKPKQKVKTLYRVKCLQHFSKWRLFNNIKSGASL